MNRTRRAFLSVAMRLGWFLPFGSLLAGFAGRDAAAATTARTLAAYLDTLLPGDELAPGAGALGIGERFQAKAARHPNYRLLLELGCQWLDQRAKDLGAPDFASLDADDRERLVDRAAHAGGVARLFFDATHGEALFAYYAHPAAWAGIGYGGPPQPEGFLDYTQPPAKL